jgi:glycosyltransferase involved in cell wall biosynthesis
MKILLYNNSHLPRIGGKEIVVHQLALAYRALGHDVLLAGPGGWWRFRSFRPDYPIHRWPRVPGLPKELVWQAQYRWTTRRFRCDVVHAHTTYPCGWVAARSRGAGNYPIVVTPHGADIHKVPEIGFGHRLEPIMDAKIRWALQQADCATAISKSVVSSLRDAGLHSDRIVEVPNGVDVQRFRRRSNFDVHACLGIPRNAALIVSVGNYHPRKGHELLIRAVRRASRQIPNLRLVIVGGGSAHLAPFVEREGIGDLVKFTGSLPYPLPGDDRPDVLAALLQASSLYVSSSIGEGSEGLSLALLESMAAGVCTVASDVSGNRDVIVHKKNGWLFPSNSESELTDALVELCRDEGLRHRLGAAARSDVDQHSWINIAGRYIDLFEHAMRVRRVGGRLYPRKTLRTEEPTG